MKQRADLFLRITGIAVVLFGFYIAYSWGAYEQDRDNHRATYITNDHVTNLHHELVTDD